MDDLSHRRCGNQKNPYCSSVINVVYRSKFCSSSTKKQKIANLWEKDGKERLYNNKPSCLLILFIFNSLYLLKNCEKICNLWICCFIQFHNLRCIRACLCRHLQQFMKKQLNIYNNHIIHRTLFNNSNPPKKSNLHVLWMIFLN